jgi:hypothetical protein
MNPRIVAGEPTDVLLAALRQLAFRRTGADTVRISGTLNRELGEPLHRALTRIERELLAQDKAGGGRTHARTLEQRRADALVRAYTSCDGCQEVCRA